MDCAGARRWKPLGDCMACSATRIQINRRLVLLNLVHLLHLMREMQEAGLHKPRWAKVGELRRREQHLGRWLPVFFNSIAGGSRCWDWKTDFERLAAETKRDFYSRRACLTRSGWSVSHRAMTITNHLVDLVGADDDLQRIFSSLFRSHKGLWCV